MMDKDNKVVDEYKEELFKSFFNSLPEGLKQTDIAAQIRHAYDFAYSAHYGVYRKCGDSIPYITHPVAVAQIVANEIGLGVSAVVSALLHDVVEDTEFTREDIKNEFGETVANMVEGLTKITNVYDAKKNTQAETFKKMLISIPHDSRVAFIKIADRLHNMRTMDEMPDGTRQIKAAENLYVYVPIADQLGLYDVKNELEDTSFKYAHPKKYEAIVKDVQDHIDARSKSLAKFRMSLMRVLVRTGQTVKLSTVKKSYYQIWSAVQNTGTTVDQANFETIRIIFDIDSDASDDDIVSTHYRLYATVINNFPERVDSKRDYVINPKSNGFKALVFQVMFEGHWIEIQIMTSDDDLVAHRGYSYKHPTRKGLEALKLNLQDFDKEQDAVQLINRFRSLSNLVTIFVFTPKGSIIELPQGSTVLDFAYAIHSRMGNHCLGALVEQKIVPVNHVLKTTDQVTVLTSPSAKPSRDWYNYIKSDHAKSCLDKYFKNNIQTDKSDIIKGKQDFNKLLRDNRVIPTLLLSGRILAQYKLPNSDELYRKLGRQEIKIEELWDCIKKIRAITDRKVRHHDYVLPIKDTPASSYLPPEINYRKPFLIDGRFTSMLSTCCCPISGDDAMCSADDDGVLYIHKRECINSSQMVAIKGKQTAKVEWGTNLGPMPAAISVKGTDRLGMIKDLGAILESNKVNVKSITISEDDGIFGGIIHIMVKNVEELELIVSQVQSVQGIVMVNRVTPQLGSPFAVTIAK